MDPADDEEGLFVIALLLALQENPALRDNEDDLERRALELVALGEDEMRRLAQLPQFEG